MFGDLALLARPSAAVVGARDPSERGLSLARACAAFFARERIPVVSGGARGIDAAAHDAALACGGATAVVLPQGLLTYRVPRPLFEAIEEGRAAIVSEFVPDTDWETRAAVTRNATISALSRLVCVIEPKKTGGSIRTARCALAQRKRVLVYCAPDQRSTGRMLKQAGAQDLVDHTGNPDPEYLQTIWRMAPQPVAQQTELF